MVFVLAHRHKLGENEVDLALETLDQMGHLAVHRLLLRIALILVEKILSLLFIMKPMYTLI